jgi:hypothetical protein
MQAMALPTFVIGGAPKAGTTAIWHWLSAHPQVWMSPIKEPHFLTRDANHPVPGVDIIGAPRANTHSRGIEWYESLFAGGEGCLARGEASTHYLGAVDGPELMEQFVPGLKVLFVLRQPVDRAYSHYWHNRKRGHDLPPFAAVLEDDPRLRYVMYMSRYAQHLQRYLDALGPERVHVLLYDDVRADPRAAYAEICRYIGVDDRFEPELRREHNPHAEPASGTLQRLIARSTYRRWGFLPAAIRRPARRLRSALEARNLRPAAYAPLDADLRQRLTKEFEPDISFVESLTRPLPGWRQIRAEPTDAR